MKNQAISRIAALLIGAVVINSTAIAGPGPQPVPFIPKRSEIKMPVSQTDAKEIRPIAGKRRSTKPVLKSVGAGHGIAFAR